MVVAILITLVVLVVCWAISAALLRLSCKICQTPVPGMAGAMVMLLVIGVTGLAVEIVAGLLVGFTDPTALMTPSGRASATSLISLPIYGAIAASFYRALLPTSFLRGMGVWIVHLLLSIIAIGAIVIPLALILGAMGMAHFSVG